MISVNETRFGTITKKGKYAINHQWLKTNKEGSFELKYRAGCALKLVELVMLKQDSHSYMTFKCVRDSHKNRFCVTEEPLKIAQKAFSTHSEATGNILVQLFSRRCHSCGENDERCWVEKHTTHSFCAKCVCEKKISAPHPYGRVNAQCCLDVDCGKSLMWYSEPELEVYNKAIKIYERLKAA